jgi:hypothetical protein
MFWGAGILYGSFVLVPSARSRAQGALLLASSLVIYRAAVWVAMTLVEEGWSGLGSCTLAGLAGAAALGAVVYAQRHSRPTFSQLTRLAGVGAGGGFLFDLSSPLAEASLPVEPAFLLGYVVWQVGFTLAARLNAPAA